MTHSDNSLSPETKKELIAVLQYETWSDVPDVVQNNLTSSNVNLEEFIDRRRAIHDNHNQKQKAQHGNGA